jgi:hypothetical protein
VEDQLRAAARRGSFLEAQGLRIVEAGGLDVSPPTSSGRQKVACPTAGTDPKRKSVEARPALRAHVELSFCALP